MKEFLFCTGLAVLAFIAGGMYFQGGWKNLMEENGEPYTEGGEKLGYVYDLRTEYTRGYYQAMDDIRASFDSIPHRYPSIVSVYSTKTGIPDSIVVDTSLCRVIMR